eukprot:5414630-Prymnesium_polylepis.2
MDDVEAALPREEAAPRDSCGFEAQRSAGARSACLTLISAAASRDASVYVTVRARVMMSARRALRRGAPLWVRARFEPRTLRAVYMGGKGMDKSAFDNAGLSGVF